MLTYDPVSSLQHYPASGGMRRYGVNPYGEPIYRIVFAPSRRYLVVGEWPDGSNCAQWVVKHRNVGNLWIMERWLPAEQFAKCSREEWNRDNLILGPWPEKGEYELCHVFDVAPPSDASIETLISMIEYGRRIPFGEILAFHRKEAEKEQAERRAKAEDLIRDKLPAFGASPFVGGAGVRRVTPIPTLRSAQELGLPTRPGTRTGKLAERIIQPHMAA